MLPSQVCLFMALVMFVLGAIPPISSHANFVSIGLAFWMLALLLGIGPR